MFWYSTAGLLVLAALFILLPMRKAYKADATIGGGRRATNVALYQERLGELEADLSAGNIDKPQFDSLLAELDRNLIADAAGEPTGSIQSDEQSEALAAAISQSKFSRLVPLVFALAVPVLVYNLYSEWGYYDDIKLTDVYRQALHNVNDPKQATALVMSLKQAVQDDEDNHWAWYFLGKNYFTLGMYEQSKDAYRQAILYMEGEPDRLMVMGQFVLASYMSDDREITDDTRLVIDQALAINPSDQTVLRVLAADAQARKDYPNAITYWRQMVRANPGSSVARVYQSNIAAAQKILAAENPEQYLSAPDNHADKEFPGIELNVSLAQGIDLPPGTRVFVAARNAEKQGLPPLAAVDLTVRDLPAKITLDKSKAVGPFDLSSADTVYVTALVSYNGVAMPRSGDYRVASDSFAQSGVNGPINLVISERVP